MNENALLIKKLLKPNTVKGLFAAFSTAYGGRIAFRIESGGITLHGEEDTCGSYLAEIPLTLGVVEYAKLRVSADYSSAESIGRALALSLQNILDSENAKRSVSSETLTAYRELSVLQRATAKLSRELKTAEIGKILLEESGFSFNNGEVGAVFDYIDRDKRFGMLSCKGTDSDKIFAAFREQSMCLLFSAIDTIQIISDFDISLILDEEPRKFQSVIVIPFIDSGIYLGFMIVASPECERYMSADKKRMDIISSVASAALHNAMLFEEQKALFNSFVNAIATAIDAKSPYTAGHCKRVPWIAKELLLAANEADNGKFADFKVTDEEIEEMDVAALLHDCGKISTPEWVMDKSTKLEGIIDGIELIRLKTEIRKQGLIIAAYREAHREAHGDIAEDEGVKTLLNECDSDYDFLNRLNIGGESLDKSVIERLQQIAKASLAFSDGDCEPMLSKDELEKLSVARGTLTEDERRIIEDHVTKTVMMLSEIKFPRNMSDVTRIASMHHEKLNGNGYPYGKKGSEICLKSRIIAIADIFEALTAEDRPYKKPGTLDQALQIMGYMIEDNHIDGDLYRLMIESNLHIKYFSTFLPHLLKDLK